MKKLEVSKILVLTAMSVGLIACGPKSDQSAGNDQGTYSLKSTPLNEGGSGYDDEGGSGRTPPKQEKNLPVGEGGSGYAEVDPSKEGGSGITQQSNQEDFAPIGKDEGGSGITDNQENINDYAEPSKEGGSGIKPPVGEGGSGYAEVDPSKEGGSGYTVSVENDILYVNGTVTQKDLKAVYLMFNGQDPYEIVIANMTFSAKIELSEKDLSGMSFQVVIEKDVYTYMFNEKVGLEEIKF